jgi:hypothetical protein
MRWMWWQWIYRSSRLGALFITPHPPLLDELEVLSWIDKKSTPLFSIRNLISNFASFPMHAAFLFRTANVDIAYVIIECAI